MQNNELRYKWERWCLRLARLPGVGVWGRWLAARGYKPYTGAVSLARYFPEGFDEPGARLHCDQLVRGKHCFVGSGALLMNEPGGGPIRLGDRVYVFENSTLLTSAGGSIDIGDDTHIQPRCQFSAVKGAIRIGRKAEIAPGCAFYPYNHGTAPDRPVQDQPLESRGGITIGDEAWLGYGVVVLDGVSIGRGAIVAAGAVVASDIPDMAIAAGVPARVVRLRTAAKHPTELKAGT